MAAPGVLLFLVLPAALGAGWLRLVITAIGATAGAGVLVVVARRSRLAAVLPVLLAVELVAGGLLGQTTGPLGADRAYHDDLFATSGSTGSSRWPARTSTWTHICGPALSLGP